MQIPPIGDRVSRRAANTNAVSVNILAFQEDITKMDSDAQGCTRERWLAIAFWTSTPN